MLPDEWGSVLEAEDKPLCEGETAIRWASAVTAQRVLSPEGVSQFDGDSMPKGVHLGLSSGTYGKVDKGAVC